MGQTLRALTVKESSRGLVSTEYLWPYTQAAVAGSTPSSPTNWGGTLAVGNPGTSQPFDNIYQIQGTIVVPPVAVPNGAACENASTIYLASQWVGLGGANLPPNYEEVLFQAGVDERYNCSTNTPVYVAWWECFPANNEAPFNDYPVVANDVLQVNVSYPANSIWGKSPPVMSYSVTNETEGWTASGTYTDTKYGVPVWTGEAITERACDVCTALTTGPGPNYQAMPQPSNLDFPFTGLYYSAQANFGLYTDLPLNDPFTQANCLNDDYQPIDCADPMTVTLTADACDSGMPDAESGSVSSVIYSYSGVPNKATFPGGPLTICAPQSNPLRNAIAGGGSDPIISASRLR